MGMLMCLFRLLHIFHIFMHWLGRAAAFFVGLCYFFLFVSILFFNLYVFVVCNIIYSTSSAQMERTSHFRMSAFKCFHVIRFISRRVGRSDSILFWNICNNLFRFFFFSNVSLTLLFGDVLRLQTSPTETDTFPILILEIRQLRSQFQLRAWDLCSHMNSDPS